MLRPLFDLIPPASGVRHRSYDPLNALCMELNYLNKLILLKLNFIQLILILIKFLFNFFGIKFYFYFLELNFIFFFLELNFLKILFLIKFF